MFFANKSYLVIILIGLLGIAIASPVLSEPPTQPPINDLSLMALFTGEEVPTIVTDLEGNLIGEGIHTGEVKCQNGHCNKKTQLDLNLSGSVVTFEYKFADYAVIDAEGFAILTGTGKIFSDGQVDRFAFTVTIQDNFDGTVFVSYEASNSDASFTIPSSPGTVEITE